MSKRIIAIAFIFCLVSSGRGLAAERTTGDEPEGGKVQSAVRALPEAGVEPAHGDFRETDRPRVCAHAEVVHESGADAVDLAIDRQFEVPHCEVGTELAVLESLPGIIVVDHMGRPDIAKGVDHPDFQRFIDLMRECIGEVKEIMPWDLEEMMADDPDLLVLDDDGARFVEVKTSGDQLRRNQLLRIEEQLDTGALYGGPLFPSFG